MKAKECTEIYLNARSKKKAIVEICNMFLADTRDLIKARKLNNPTSLKALIQEQSNKWKAMSRQLDGQVFKEDGYVLLIKNQFPEIAEYI